jgi:hypothetical protein
MHTLLKWLEPVLAVGGLTAAAFGGLPYLAGYGHHPYNCLAQVLPCVVYSKPDFAAGIVAVALSLVLLGAFTAVAILDVLEKRRLFLYVLLAIAATYWVALIVVAGGFFVEPYQISADCLVVACLAAVIRRLGRNRSAVKPASIAVGSSVGIWCISGFAAWSLAPCLFAFFACIPQIHPLPPDAWNSLEYAVPTAYDSSGNFIGFDRFTADELNRIHQGSRLRSLHFVNADTPSTGPAIVSVNSIDRFTWAAVALSTGGRCYSILVSYGRLLDRYGVLPAGSPCVGSAATPATVTATAWPAAR